MIRLGKEAGLRVLVDPTHNHDYSKYAGATLLTPNRCDASTVVGFEVCTTTDAAKAAQRLAESLSLEALVITLDKDGAYLSAGDVREMIPARPRNVYDVTGAGDIVLATLAVSLAAESDYLTAAHLANIAAGIEVEKFGATPVTVSEMIHEIADQFGARNVKLRSLDSLMEEINWRRSRGQTIVFTNGCFDVIHRGHIEYLRFCKAQGDVVVVGLNSDSSVRTLKGPERPINSQFDRADRALRTRNGGLYHDLRRSQRAGPDQEGQAGRADQRRRLGQQGRRRRLRFRRVLRRQGDARAARAGQELDRHHREDQSPPGR